MLRKQTMEYITDYNYFTPTVSLACNIKSATIKHPSYNIVYCV